MIQFFIKRYFQTDNIMGLCISRPLALCLAPDPDLRSRPPVLTPNLYLPALAPNLYLQALATSLYHPALAPNLCLPTLNTSHKF